MNLTKSYIDKKVYPVKHQTVDIDGISIFYREAGNPAAETILMLHGFPSSSHMYRKIIEGLAEQYHVIAPDYPGFGFSDTPSIADFEYTFDNISIVMKQFIKTLKLKQFYLLMQDYGGPIGMRIATADPGLIKGLIIQNANLYLEGLGEWPQKMKAYAEQKAFEELAAFKNYLLSPEGIKEQYIAGAFHPDKIDSVAYLTDNAFFDRAHVREIQTVLMNNYASNFPKYPEWQAYLKKFQPRTLVLWGEHDKFFSKSGGSAYGKDLNNVEIHFFNGGHFMMEEYPEEATSIISAFLNK